MTGGAEYGSQSVLGKRGASADRRTVSASNVKERQTSAGRGRINEWAAKGKSEEEQEYG